MVRRDRERKMSHRRTMFSFKVGRIILCFLFVLGYIKTVQCWEFSKEINEYISSKCLSPRNIDVNNITGAIHIACFNDIINIVPNSNEDTTIITTLNDPSLCLHPTSVYVDSIPGSQGFLYVACQGASSASVISISFGENGAAIKPLATISECLDPSSLVFSRVLGIPKSLYVTCSRGSTATVISVGNSGVVTITDSSQCSSPTSIIANSFRGLPGLLYVACQGGFVGAVIGISGNRGIAPVVSFERCPQPSSLAADSITGTIYAICIDTDSGGEVIGVDGETVTTLVDASRCRNPSGIVAGGILGFLYVSCRDGPIGTVISINSGTIVTLLDAIQCRTPTSLAVSNILGILKSLYVICADMNTGIEIIRIPINSNTPLALTTSSQCSYPKSIAINSITGIIYGICTGANTGPKVISIDGETIKSVAISFQCFIPSNIVVNSITGTIYVTCFDADMGTDAAVISINDDAVVTTLVLFSQCQIPVGIILEENMDIVHILCSGANSRVVSIEGGTIRGLGISLDCPTPSSIAIDRVLDLPRSIYVTCGGIDAGIIRIEGRSIIKSGASLRCPILGNIAVNSITGTVYATCIGADVGVISIDIDNRGTITILATSSQCPNPQSIAVDSASNTIYVACGDVGVISIDENLVATLVTSVQCPNPQSIAITSSNSKKWEKQLGNSGTVYVACSGGYLIASTSDFNCPYGFCWTNSGCSPCHIESFSNSTFVGCNKCFIESIVVTLDTGCSPCEISGSIFLVILYSIVFIGVTHYLSQPGTSTSFAIFICAIQVVSIIYRDEIVLFIGRSQKLTNLCLPLLNPHQAMAVDIMTPFLYFYALALFMVTHLCFNRCLRCFIHPQSLDSNFLRFVDRITSFDKERYIRTFSSLYLASHSIILTLFFRYMHCILVYTEFESTTRFETKLSSLRSRSEDRTVLYFNLGVSCEDSKYTYWLVFAIFLCGFIVCLMPIMIMIYLCRDSPRPNNEKLFSHVYGLLYGPLHGEMFYHHTFVLVRYLTVGVFATILMVYPREMCIPLALLHGFLCIVNWCVGRPYGKSISDDLGEMNLLFFTLISCILTVYPSLSFSKNVIPIIVVLYIIPFNVLIMEASWPDAFNFVAARTRDVGGPNLPSDLNPYFATNTKKELGSRATRHTKSRRSSKEK